MTVEYGLAHPVDYDDDPSRFAANQMATRRFLAGSDVHHDLGTPQTSPG